MRPVQFGAGIDHPATAAAFLAFPLDDFPPVLDTGLKDSTSQSIQDRPANTDSNIRL